MNGFLVRVGIDGSCGNWNAPVEPGGRFAYVPIPESPDRPFRAGFGRFYGELTDTLGALGIPLPTHLENRPMHLDPDFEHLTYGDQGAKAARLASSAPGDFFVFYGGFRNTRTRELNYGIFGLLTVESMEDARAIPNSRWHENAHTRREPAAGEVVFRGDPQRSGRLAGLMVIGEYRDRAYRVRPDILKAWGGLSVRDGYLQRSANPPKFVAPQRFLDWFGKNSGPLARGN